MINKLKEELPQNMYRYTEKNHVMKIGKSRLTFGYCQTKNDIRQFQGIEYDFICIEEITQWTYEEFRILMSSLRTSKDRYQPNCFMSGNPGGIGHAWVKRLFVDRDFDPSENEKADDYVFIPATIYDNPVLMNNDPSYYQNLLSLPGQWRKAYLE
jgi:phage terminase large subunit